MLYFLIRGDEWIAICVETHEEPAAVLADVMRKAERITNPEWRRHSPSVH